MWYEVPSNLLEYWLKIMNDANFIKEEQIFYKDFYDFGRKRIYRFNPNRLYQKEDYFSYFKGEKFIETIQAKYWLFGHYHQEYYKEYQGVKLLSSPLGYKNKKSNFKLKKITL